MRATLPWMLALVPLLAGCSDVPGASSSPTGGDTLPAAAEVRPTVGWVNMTYTGDVKVPGHEVVLLLQRQGDLPGTHNATALVVEMAWTAQTPATTDLELKVYDGRSGAVVAQAAGPSPLRLVLDDVPSDTRAAFSPAGPAGAVVHQTVSIVASVFRGATPPQDYSALA